MSESEIFKGARREKLGTRPARKLRAEGRIPASLQVPGEDLHVDFSVSEREFLASRRHHTHLYDLDIDGVQETALVRELQWDTFGEHVLHIEFKRVRRDEKTETNVELAFRGQPKGGVLNHLLTQVRIVSIPANIPDSIEVRVADLQPGDTITAADLKLPEGVELMLAPETVIAIVMAPRGEAELGPEVVEAPPEGLTPPSPAGPEGETGS